MSSQVLRFLPGSGFQGLHYERHAWEGLWPIAAVAFVAQDEYHPRLIQLI